MVDYISRQAAIDAIHNKMILVGSYLTDSSVGFEFAEDEINNLPSANVVPVVRCKECKHVNCRIYHGWQEPIYTCTRLRSRWNTDNDLEVNPNGFCSYGERKE